MGRSYAFECPKCGFTARVSGRDDRGNHCFTRTIVCHDCKNLYDVATHIRLSREAGFPQRLAFGLLDRGFSPASLACRMPLPGHVSASMRPVGRGRNLLNSFNARIRSGWVALKLECPAFTHHRIIPWTDPGKCPRCGTFLERTLTPYRIWE